VVCIVSLLPAGRNARKRVARSEPRFSDHSAGRHRVKLFSVQAEQADLDVGGASVKLLPRARPRAGPALREGQRP
jgi:hypothetical protein